MTPLGNKSLIFTAPAEEIIHNAENSVANEWCVRDHTLMARMNVACRIAIMPK
jgi:hypothetical protein